MFGGYPGAPSLLMLKEGTRVAEMIAENKSLDQLDEVGGSGRLLPYCEFDVGKNDVLYMRMSSGGGYGDPLEREPERVLSDVEDGIVSREEAKEIYGVVIEGDDLLLDLAATDKMRASLRQERLQDSPERIRNAKAGGGTVVGCARARPRHSSQFLHNHVVYQTRLFG